MCFAGGYFFFFGKTILLAELGLEVSTRTAFTALLGTRVRVRVTRCLGTFPALLSVENADVVLRLFPHFLFLSPLLLTTPTHLSLRLNRRQTRLQCCPNPSFIDFFSHSQTRTPSSHAHAGSRGTSRPLRSFSPPKSIFLYCFFCRLSLPFSFFFISSVEACRIRSSTAHQFGCRRALLALVLTHHQ